MTNTKEPMVRISGNRLITTSLAISNHFQKRHKDVLRSIQDIECSEEFARRNFAPCTYTDGNQRQRPMYEITRDGFMFLCMGFTGASAAQWKEKYIAAFNALAEAQQQHVHQLNSILAQNTDLKNELLKQVPDYRALKIMHDGGLERWQMAAAVNLSRHTISKRLTVMRRLGLIDSNAQQCKQLTFIFGGEK